MKILALGRGDISHPYAGYAHAVFWSLSALAARGHEVIYVPFGKPLGRIPLNARSSVFVFPTSSKAFLQTSVSSSVLFRVLATSGAAELLTMLRDHDHDLLTDLQRDWQPDLVLHEGPDRGREPRRLRALGIPLAERFHEVGMRFYIENFGTWEEYSGFRYRFPLSFVASKAVGLAVKSLQRRLAKSADYVIAVSQRDCRVLEAWGVRARTVLLPYAAPGPADEGWGGQPPDVMIPGSTYSVNQLEVRFAARLASELPSFRFAVSGVRKAPGGCPRNLEIGFFDRATYTNYMRGARLVVIPVLFAQGLQTKVSEALAYGKPVLTTPLALEEFPGLRPWREVAVEDDPRRFAETIRYLLEDGRASKDLSSGARAYYSSSPINPEVHGEVLGRVLEQWG